MTNTPGDGSPQDPSSPSGPPAPPPPGYAPPGYGYQQGYQQPAAPQGWYAGPPAYRLPDHPQATKAMVLGLIALIGGFTCYLPLLLGPWAWVVGRRAVREIDAQPGRYEARGQAMAGYVMGVIATVLLVLGILAVIGFLTLLVVTSVTEGPTPVPGESL
jgi:hypothetical protein